MIRTAFAPFAVLAMLAAAALSPDALADEGGATPASTYRFSYHSLLRDPAPDMYEHMLGADCVAKIRELLANGESFYSKAIADALVPVDSYSYPSGAADRRFYHWTYSEKAKRYAKQGNYDEIFSFLREQRNYQYGWGSVFYVAEDPESSRGYGNHLIHIDFRPEAKVLRMDFLRANAAAIRDVSARYPELRACNGTGNVGLVSLLAFEDSGVDLIDYQGAHRWFMVIGPTAIEAMGAGK